MNDPNLDKILRSIKAKTLIDFLKTVPAMKLKRFHYPKHSRVFRSQLYKSIAKDAQKTERAGMGEFAELVCFDLVMLENDAKNIVKAIEAIYNHMGWKLADVRPYSNHLNNVALLTFSKVSPR